MASKVDSKKLEHGCSGGLIKSPAGDVGPCKGHVRLYGNMGVGRFPSFVGLGLEDGHVPTFWLLLSALGPA